jgi:hypothetical protein
MTRLHKSTLTPALDHPGYIFRFQRFDIRQGRRSTTSVSASNWGLCFCFRVGAILVISDGHDGQEEGLTAPIHNGNIPLLGSSSLAEILDCTLCSQSFLDVRSKEIPASFIPASTVFQDTRMGWTTWYTNWALDCRAISILLVSVALAQLEMDMTDMVCAARSTGSHEGS